MSQAYISPCKILALRLFRHSLLKCKRLNKHSSLVLFSVLIEPTWSITTTHHSKAPHRTPRRPSNPPINVTVSLSDRQKRLLPYYNFYLAQDINRPVVLRRYKQPQRPVQIKAPRPGESFTPFLESNALPGPFIPIQKPTEQQQQYRGDEETVPNYSGIYDKLSQLKLVQRRPQQSYQSYHVIPSGRPQYAETDHNSIQQGKTIIQTYTPTEVEISSSHPLENEVYVSTVAPKLEGEVYITTARPETQPYQLYNLVHQDHIQPLTVDEITQYEKDKNQYTDSRKPIIVYQQPEQIQRPVIYLPEYKQQPTPPPVEKASLDTLLKKLQASNTLPQTLTTDNIDNSIKTLVKILSGLKKQPKFTKPIVVADETDYVDNAAVVDDNQPPSEDDEMYPPDTVEGGTPGRPGVDYPALSSIPQTSFNCKTQRYKGFFGDPDTNCQVREKNSIGRPVNCQINPELT